MQKVLYLFYSTKKARSSRHFRGPRAFIFQAEEEGFEPPRGVTRLSVFKTDPFSQTWVFLHFDKKDYNPHD